MFPSNRRNDSGTPIAAAAEVMTMRMMNNDESQLYFTRTLID